MKLKEFVRELSGSTFVKMVDPDNHVFSYDQWPYREVLEMDIQSKCLSIFISQNSCTINVSGLLIKYDDRDRPAPRYDKGRSALLDDIRMRLSKQSTIITNLEEQLRIHQSIYKSLKDEMNTLEMNIKQISPQNDIDVPLDYLIEFSRARQHAYESSLNINKNLPDGDSIPATKLPRPEEVSLKSLKYLNYLGDDKMSSLGTSDEFRNEIKKARKKIISALSPIEEKVDVILTDMDAIQLSIGEKSAEIMDETIRNIRSIDALEKRVSNVTTWASESSIIHENEYKGLNRKLDLILDLLNNKATNTKVDNDKADIEEKAQESPSKTTKSTKRK